MILAIGAWQVIIIGIVPLILIFIIGFAIGKKAGYIKRIREVERRDD